MGCNFYYETKCTDPPVTIAFAHLNWQSFLENARCWQAMITFGSPKYEKR